MKRKALIVLASVALLWGLLFALQFTFAGYILVGMFGMEYYRTLNFGHQKMESEGDSPSSLRLQFGRQPPKQGALVPCLLLYSIDDSTNMLVYVNVPQDWYGAQYLDLTRLDLVMQDGRREELVRQSGPVVTTWSRQSGRTDSYASGEPVRFCFGQPQSERIFFKRCGRWLERVVMDPATPGQACFYATLWPPTEKVTLIAEGTIHRELCREDQPFRQVSTWKITRGWGLRRVWLP